MNSRNVPVPGRIYRLLNDIAVRREGEWIEIPTGSLFFTIAAHAAPVSCLVEMLFESVKISYYLYPHEYELVEG